MPARLVLPRARAGQLYVESDRQFLQYDWSVGIHSVHDRYVLPDLGIERADGQLQRRFLLSVWFERFDAGRLSADDILSDRESCDDYLSRVVILRLHGHEHADLVLRGIVLRPDGSERRVWSVQRRLLLQCWLVVPDTARLFNRHVLPDRQRQCDRVCARIILPVAIVADSLPGRHLMQCNGTH
jgi:hypothetical protein